MALNELTLSINQDTLYEFFNAYDPLSPLQKKIWKAMVWWCKRFPSAFPSQEKIAEHVGCSRKHVNRTIKIFKDLGFLVLIHRGRKRTKVLHIFEQYLAIDIAKRQYFRRIEVTSKVTHSYSNNRTLTSRGTGEIATEAKEEIRIPQIAVELNFSRKNALKLGLVTESTLQEVLRKCKNLGSQGWKPKSAEAYMVGMAINLSKSRNESLDWKKFYRQLAI